MIFPKNGQFICDFCDITTNNKKDFVKHLATAKHKKRSKSGEILGEILENIPKPCFPFQYTFLCDCGKKYKHDQSLRTHKKKCTYKNNVNQDPSLNELDKITTAMIDLMKNNQVILTENKEFKELIMEQNKQIIELVKEKGFSGGNVTNSHNTTTNNKFNLNLFLNEQCKDAMNITDFIKSMEISFEEFENVGTLGYAEGISQIIINNLKNTELVKRPMHCSDLKRETMYIKDKDAWENDKEKTLFISAIKGVAHKNFMKSVDWKIKHPDYKDSSSKTMDKYNKILYETCGPESKEEREKEYNKILRRIAKEVVIEK